MAAITWAQVVAFAAELSPVDVIAQDLILAFVNTELAPDYFGGEESSKLTLARIYYAAHLGTITKRGDSAAGPVTGESEGGVSVQYASFSPAGSDPLMGTTSYGKQYMQLVRSSPGRLPCAV